MAAVMVTPVRGPRQGKQVWLTARIPGTRVFRVYDFPDGPARLLSGGYLHENELAPADRGDFFAEPKSGGWRMFWQNLAFLFTQTPERFYWLVGPLVR